ncbi:alpha-keto ester reductase-like protein [Leucosporidium creatinivorum]|uniref:Alpha-keto ester reductase-like protein n=1 Tax=Leucosporidium creatinivorum TaxID=106004 RepID=A0A1Y2DB05_9BASI|nr:alpha-keto ester reductase-like protein [Leucosporidium creatinivorum]
MTQSTYPVRKLSDGTEIPGVGYGVGTAWYGRSGIDEELVTAVSTALKAGYTHLDNAEAYGNEESVGEALKRANIPREKLFITTKVGSGLKDIRQAFKSSLSKLGVSYVDLYLIHWPYDLGKDGYPTHEEAWKILEELKDEGLAKSIGVSNYRIKDLERTLAVARHRPVVNQIELHPFVLPAAKPLLEYLKQENITVEAYGPTSPITKFSGTSFDKVLEKVTASVSERAGSKVEGSQVLLHLASTLGAVVVTTSGKEQLLAGGLPALTEEEIKELTTGAPHHARVFMKHMDE